MPSKTIDTAFFEVQEATSGGGTGASQAFSEVGIDPRRDGAVPAQHTAGKASGADDSGSSHASEPHGRVSTANQARTDGHTGLQHVTPPAGSGAISHWQPTALAGIVQAAASASDCQYHVHLQLS